jgi:TATA-box binding protein (TBP) (component of TFIID and TFIIIB)
MVQIAKINSEIKLKELALSLNINDNIKYIEFSSLVQKGEKNTKKGKTKSKTNNKKKKYFYNQVTVHIMLDKIINLKIFNNGRIQMTGIKNDKHGLLSLNLILEEFNKLSENDKLDIFDNTEITSDKEIQTVLINSDFDMKYTIDRSILHRLIIDHGYYSSYEPCTYPGVNIKYYMNTLRNNFGICDCDKPCNGKGKNNTCKRITVAVFNSGKAIITGSNSIENLIITHKFITEFINENKSLLNKE